LANDDDNDVSVVANKLNFLTVDPPGAMVVLLYLVTLGLLVDAWLSSWRHSTEHITTTANINNIDKPHIWHLVTHTQNSKKYDNSPNFLGLENDQKRLLRVIF
jgi:hypothetical protein